MTRSCKLNVVFGVLVASIVSLSLCAGGPAPTFRFTVVIDPGHGGKDPGASGPGGACEKEITLAIAQMVYLKSLSTPDLQVVLARRGDEYIFPTDRVLEANRVGADLYVSVHANAHASAKVSGIETFVDVGESTGGRSWRLAEAVQRRLVSYTGADDRGVKQAELFIRHADMPAVVTEVGFLTNRLEASLLQSLTYEERVADALLAAVLDYAGAR